MGFPKSNADHTKKISQSVFMTNFPDSTNSGDLWKVYSAYGTVIDVFIPNKKAKSDKRFAFVRFIKVSNLLRLVENLCTIWIGRHHLYANQVRFERPHKPNFPPLKETYGAPNKTPNSMGSGHLNRRPGSYASVANGSSFSPSPTLVIGKKWGEVVDLEDNEDSFFRRKRLCIKTKHAVSILEAFKIIVKGKVFMVRVKELFSWNPIFLPHKEMVIYSDDEFVHFKFVQSRSKDDESSSEGTSDDEEIPKTIFDDNPPSPNHCGEMGDPPSKDLFKTYDLLKKKSVEVVHESSPSLTHPSGFTPDCVVSSKANGHETEGSARESTKSPRSSFNAKVMNSSQEVHAEVNSDYVGPKAVKHGGSVLEVMEEMIRVGQVLGYSMDGCLGRKPKKEWIKELTIKNKINFLSIQETKMSCISQMDMKFMWGNSNYDFVFSESLRYSGGILCVWEASVFKKDNVTISDNFVAIYGTGVPSSSKIIFVAIYAPHDVQCKRILWDYVMTLIVCLDRHLSDHRPILLHEAHTDFGPTPFRFYHSWFELAGFDDMVEQKWRSFSHSDGNRMVRNELHVIDKELYNGVVSDASLLRRLKLNRQLNEINAIETKDFIQKSKVKWAIEGDENSKFSHGLINKKRSQLAIRGVFIDGLWCTDPVQAADLEMCISRDEIRLAVWSCRANKSPGPDGFTFEFFKNYWNFVRLDFCEAVEYFFEYRSFPKGCNSSFVALIPKVTDAKLVNDFRPISLIGCVYKVVTKILTNRLDVVIPDLISDTQSAFVAGRQILDGPFILNEILHWCKRKNKQVMFFKVDLAKAYDSVRWDYLLDMLEGLVLVNLGASGFEVRSVLLRLLFWLMEVLPMNSLSIVVLSKVILWPRVRLQGSLLISHLFYADDALFLGEWSDKNLEVIIHTLRCFHLALGLKINIQKCQLLGVGVPRPIVEKAARCIGCDVLQNQFRCLGVMVGECMSRHKAWEDTVVKLKNRLSKWKAKTLSIGERLTLLKSVLGASPLYSMSIFKVPRGILKAMEAIRNNFFIGADPSVKKITLVAWDKVLASKKHGGLGSHSVNSSTIWSFILRELQSLKDKDALVAVKMVGSLDHSFHRIVRDGMEQQQMIDLILILESVSLSTSQDRWICDLSGDGEFRAKEVRIFLDDLFLLSFSEPTRWVKCVPIKINIFTWHARRDCLPTRSNLARRGISLESSRCPLCDVSEEDIHHVLFRCSLAQLILRRICRWWELEWQPWISFSEWQVWFSSIRILSKVKRLLEGVFYVAWWSISNLRNRTVFDDIPPRPSEVFDDIVSLSFTWCHSRCNREIDIVLSWPSEEAPPVIKRSLDVNQDIGFVEVISEIDDVFDIGKSNVESIEVCNEFSKFSENKESVKEVVVGGGEGIGIGDAHRLMDNRRNHKFIQPNVLGWMPDSQLAYSAYHLNGKVIFEGGKSVIEWVAKGERMVLCYVQGSRRRKRKKGVGCGSGRHENYRSERRDSGRSRISNPGIKLHFRHHLEDKVVVKEWGMIRPRFG
nr:RNA-directed DNA polymerase, eukaryota [Tanacetum cinerariifolium]